MKQRNTANRHVKSPWHPAVVWKTLIVLLMLAVLVGVPEASLAQPPSEDETLEAQKRPKKHQKRKKRPIVLGVSGGNVTDRVVAGGFITCASGTLGGLVEKDGTQYIVSNNHVLALTNKGKKGDPVNQPGLIDKSCQVIPGDFVANLTAFKKIRFNGNNFADVAVAEVIPGMVNSKGKILIVKTPGNDTVDASLNQPVKKSGRTSGHTKGIVIATGATLSVSFASADLTNQALTTAKFKNQIIVTGNTEPFSDSGDSGAFVYEDVKKCPRAVGLLFAGSDQITAISPMDKVLQIISKLKPKGDAQLVGCSPMAASGEALATQAAVTSAPIHLLSPDRDELRMARLAQRMQEHRILAIRGVTGIGIGSAVEDASRAVLKIMVEKATPEILERIPHEIGGVQTEILVTGRIKAY